MLPSSRSLIILGGRFVRQRTIYRSLIISRKHDVGMCDDVMKKTLSGRYPLLAQKKKHDGLDRRCIQLTPSRLMFIQVEETPNPNSLKFYPGEIVLEGGTIDFQDKVQGSLKSPLAKALFRIKGVKSVFFAQDFLTVSKEDDEKVEWNVLKPQIFSAIMIFYTMKQPILYSAVDSDPNEVKEEDSEIVKEIKTLITDRIRPTIQEDGGDLEFVSYEDSVVRIKLQGACTSCPSSVVTLKSGVKNMLQYYIPEVVDVEQVIDDD